MKTGIGGGVSDHVRRLVGALDRWRLCMSHNESYFGEPAGLLKATVAELARAVDPIYPAEPEPANPFAGVVIYTTDGEALTLARAWDDARNSGTNWNLHTAEEFMDDVMARARAAMVAP